MVTYVLYCYTKNRDPHDPKTMLFEQAETFGAARGTAYVQNKLVHNALDRGFFVKAVEVVKGEAAS